jgi:uncharacterized protein YbjT (DUF2867 family)
MSGKRVMLAGATGMVGGLALRECLRRDDVVDVTVLGRRSTGVTDPKVREVLHADFADFRAVGDVFAEQDVALFCLGAYTGAVPDDELRRVTVDYAVAFAGALHDRSPQATVCFLSGQGADQSERSRIAFARYKGAAERALIALGFPRVHIFRPGYVYPVTPRQEPTVMYRVMRALYPVARRLYPNIGVASDDLARAMVDAGLDDTASEGASILENRDIRVLAERAR